MQVLNGEVEVGDAVLYMPDFEQATEMMDNLTTVALSDRTLVEMGPIINAMAYRTVVATYPLFMVKCEVTGEIFEDDPQLYITAKGLK